MNSLSIRSGLLIAASLSALTTAKAQTVEFWNTNGTTATWTSANWGTTSAGPFGTAWTTGNSAEFTANSTLTFATTTISNVTVDAGVAVTITSGGTLSLGAVRIFDVENGGTLTWQGQNVTANSAGGITKNGTGTLDLGALTFTTNMTGGFTLNAGTVLVSGNKALGNGSLTINSGTLSSTGTRAFAVTSIAIGGNFTFAGTGNANFGTGNITLGSSTRTITNSTTSGSRQLTGIISGGSGAGLTFAGTGAAQIYVGNTGNTFSGPVSITGGEVVFNGDGALGNGTNSITLDGGRLTMASMDPSGNTTALTTATISSARTISVGSTAGTSISITGATGVTTYNGTIQDVSGETGSWAKQGAGELQLGGVSTYSGSTNINNGTLQLTTGSNRLPTGTTVSLGQAASSNVGAFDLNGQNQQIAGLNSTLGTNASSSAKNTVTSSGAATLTIGGSGTYSYGAGTAANSGVITGAVHVVMNGAGSQTLGDANTYTGGTTVTNGTLIAGSATALGTGTITVNGGSLVTANSLTVGDNFTLTSGSVAPNGTNVGNLSLASGKSFTMSGGTLSLTLGTSFDQIMGSGALTINGGTLALDTTGAGFSYSNTYHVFTGFATDTITDLIFTGYDTADYQASVDNSGNLEFSAVPEPSTYALIAGGAALMVAFVQRRRQAAV